jgi:methionyl-tRNA synthetase
MNLARAANKYFNDAQPWKTVKADPQRCATTIHTCLQVVRGLSILMSPIVPEASQRLWGMLGLPGAVEGQSWESAGRPGISSGHTIGTPAILFTKIEDDVIEHELDRLGKPAEEVPPPTPTVPAKPTITIDDFKKVDLRIATVVAAERVPKSDKLLKITVQIGTEQRQIVAGIAQHYTPEDLAGRSVVVVFNLQPAKLMGQESQGMLLAASDTQGRLVILSPAAEIDSGSVVK